MNRRDFLKTSSSASVGAAVVAMSSPLVGSAAEPVPILGKLVQPIEFAEQYLESWCAYRQEWSCKWSSDGKYYNQITNVTRLSEFKREDLDPLLRKVFDDDAKQAITKTIRTTV